jgi:hypothetical protein
MKEFIDKLIGRLEEEKQGKLNLYCDGLNFAMRTAKELAEEYEREHIVDLCNQICNKADEILQKSEEDVCYCQRDYSYISDKYKVQTRCGYTFYDLHHAKPFKYCPYCGKKIKVVE